MPDHKMKDDYLVIDYRPGEYRMEFTVFHVMYWESTGPDGIISTATGYHEKDGNGSDYTEDRDQAEVFASGSIKWDGCMNMQFDSQESCMLHFCGRDHARSVGRMFDVLYDLAEKNIARADPEIMG